MRSGRANATLDRIACRVAVAPEGPDASASPLPGAEQRLRHRLGPAVRAAHAQHGATRFLLWSEARDVLQRHKSPLLTPRDWSDLAPYLLVTLHGTVTPDTPQPLTTYLDWAALTQMIGELPAGELLLSLHTGPRSRLDDTGASPSARLSMPTSQAAASRSTSTCRAARRRAPRCASSLRSATPATCPGTRRCRGPSTWKPRWTGRPSSSTWRST